MLVIEKAENANLSHGYGVLNLATFDPFQKNPPISRVFREIGLADELRSGMRNTYKYTRMYSGEDPEFIEGDVFRIIVPLPEIATATVGPTSSSTTEVEIKLSSEKLHNLLNYCSTPRTRAEMQLFWLFRAISPCAEARSAHGYRRLAKAGRSSAQVIKHGINAAAY